MAESVKHPQPAQDDSALNPHRWLVLTVVSVAQLMLVLDVTIMNIALPSAQEDLDFSNDNRQWIITAYALAFGSLLLFGGRIADLFGRKNVFLIGLVGFAAASALGGAATNFGMLAGARALQGVFGALLAPAALSLLTTTFADPKERGKAFGIFGAIVGSGAAVGLLLGGVLTEYLDWRWCMFVNIVFAVGAFIGGVIYLVPGLHAERPDIDIPGTITATVGLFLIVFGLSRAEVESWGTISAWGNITLGTVFLIAFVIIETKVAHPLLPLRVVLDRDRAGSFMAMFLTGAALFGVFLFLTYYMQNTLEYSPLKCGFAFIPMVLGIMVSAQLATMVLLPKIGPKIPVVMGMTFGAIGLVWLTAIETDSPYTSHVLPQIVLIGVGMGLVFAPAMNVATAGVDVLDAGVASAMVNTAQQVGGSIGTALLSTLATNAGNDYVKGKLPSPDVFANAAVHSYTTAFWWSAGIFAAGAVICALLMRGGTHSAATGGEPAAHLG